MYKDKEGNNNLINSAEEKLNKFSSLCLVDFFSNRKLKKDYYEGKNPQDILYDIIDKQFDHSTLDAVTKCVQCNYGHKRSAGDIYCIMKYYYPDITFEQLRELLLNLINESKIGSMHCNSIGKRVYFSERMCKQGVYSDFKGLGYIQAHNRPDEFGLSFEELC